MVIEKITNTWICPLDWWFSFAWLNRSHGRRCPWIIAKIDWFNPKVFS